MDTDLLTEHQLKRITVKDIDQLHAKEIFQSMHMTPSEWLRISNENPHTQPIENKFFAACIDNEFVGMINIQFPTTTNAHINLISVSDSTYLLSIGEKLLLTAENYCYEYGYTSITAEVIHSNQNDNKQTTYYLLEKSGYKPLFEIHSSDTRYLTTYMQKIISLDDFTFIDLTHSLSPDVPHWGIDAGFKYNARYIQSNELPNDVKFRVQRLEMSAGIGTHMDAPSHCYEHAAAIADLPLQSLITICRVIDVSNKAHETYSLTVDDVRQFEDEYGIIPKNAFVIIYTGWDQRWTQPEKYRNNKIFPNISTDAAEMLLTRDIVGIGIDTLSPDAFGSNFPIHQIMLGSGKYIIENVVNANQLPPTGSYIFALPIKIIDGTEAPIRLVGMKRKRIISK